MNAEKNHFLGQPVYCLMYPTTAFLTACLIGHLNDIVIQVTNPNDFYKSVAPRKVLQCADWHKIQQSS